MKLIEVPYIKVGIDKKCPFLLCYKNWQITKII